MGYRINETQTGVTNMTTATRTIRKNVYGNWVGYVGKARVEEFGDCETCAKYWLATGDADWFTNAWI
jgi:hypothetical protein